VTSNRRILGRRRSQRWLGGRALHLRGRSSSWRRLLSSFRILSVITTAALFVGAAVFVHPTSATSCAAFVPPLAARVAQADVIVVGSVLAVDPDRATVAPEAFLRGPARPDALILKQPPRTPECPLAMLAAGDRVVLLLNAADGGYAWPDASLAYVLKDGIARIASDQLSDDHLESQLVSDIRSQTNLYAVPAEGPDDGASIDWMKTVIPVTAALVVVFGIGLLLMRTWHRIDPS
jgi:hypothetical protein